MSKHDMARYILAMDCQSGYSNPRPTMGSANSYMYLVLIMSAFPIALDTIMTGFACKATFVSLFFASGLLILAIAGMGMITLPIKMSMRVYAKMADAMIF